MIDHMPGTTPPAGYDELQRSEFARMFGKIVGARAYIGPVAASLLLLLAAVEDVPWRRWVLVPLCLGIVVLSLLEAYRYRRRGMAPRAADFNLSVGIVGQVVGSFASGGLESPFMPLILVIALFAGMIIADRRWYYWLCFALQLAAPWLFAWIAIAGWLPDFNPQTLGGGTRGGHGDAHLWYSAAFLDFAIVLAHVLGWALRSVFESMLWRALEANDALRREHTERSQALIGLTGEIAHELKNPMASVKGLAALLSQNVGEGKGAERLGVLRQEVDRMQAILEEFLNFSRPLLPLSVERADLRGLCEEVAALHEGIARERGVDLQVEGGAQVVCDARKVRQVLINLVQNALDASAKGGRVELACEARATGAEVRVLDRGPGLDPSILPRLFEPGATTKPKGNGVGLTVARALARQHGGELSLGPREGGGCAAVLSLPATPPGVEA